MDNHKQKTTVSVHSPNIQFLSIGSCYTSYAISLKTQDSSFNLEYSQVRRRYSEFYQLRNLLESHYPTITAPPLPPKRYFRKFNDDFIEERKKGLERFLKNVLDIPVYLSDKSLHLFLQSSCNMTEICEQCLGDIPVPQLIEENYFPICKLSDTSSCISSDKPDDNTPERKTQTPIKIKDLASEDVDSDESGYASPPSPQKNISDLNRRNSSLPYSIPESQRTLSSGSCSSLSSLENSYSSSLEHHHKGLRVSFNEHVTVAVVCNRIWNVCIEPIKND